MRPPSRSGELVRGLAALAALLLLLAGLPAGLALVAGSPLPHTLPDWAQLTAALMRPDTGNTLFLAAVKVLGWAAWSLFTLITLAETAGYLRGRPARRLPGPLRPMQHLARDLVAMTALLISTGGPLAGTAPLTHQTAIVNHHAARPANTAAVEVTASSGAQPRAMLAASQAPTTGDRPWRTRVIKRGDTLWAIARHTYGSGTRYLQIFDASKHLRQPHGLPRLSDPDRIYPGQRLHIPRPEREHPANARTSGNARHAGSTPSVPVSPSPGRLDVPPPDGSAPTSAASSPGTLRHRPSPSATASAPSPAAAAHPPVTPPASNGAAPPRHPATAPPAKAPRRPESPPESTPGEQHGPPVTVTLPTGAYVGLGLATAISVALAATRLHRRRRGTHVDAWPADGCPATPSPEPVAKVRKAHLGSYTDRGAPPPSDVELVAADVTAPAPSRIDVGVREGHNLALALPGLNIGLTGPGALAAARAITTQLLARSSRYRVELVVSESDAKALLAGTGVEVAELAAAVPGLTVTPSLDAAIAHLEAEFIHRARLMETYDEPDVPALRSADPGEPLPAVVLIASVPAAAEGLRAMLQLGQRYCVGALLLGDWPAGTTVHVSVDGTVTRADGPDAAAWAEARLFNLTHSDVGAMLQVVRTGNGALERTTAAPPAPSQRHAPEPEPAQQVRPPQAPPPGRPAGHQETAAGEERLRPVQLRILGAVHVEASGKPIATGLRRITRDLLVYLALKPDGVTREQGVDALMPDRSLESGTTMFHTAINNARQTLRAATGLREPMFVIHAGGRYRLDPRLIDVDIWKLRAALDAAHRAETDADRIQRLKLIPDLYTGDLAEDVIFEWAEPEREHLRQQATGALAHLAQLLHDDHPEQAVAALQDAIRHDPLAEPLYRNLMRLHARLGRLDAVRRTYQVLASQLADLDIEPDEESHRLQAELLRTPSPAATNKKRSPRAPAPGRSGPGQATDVATATVARLRPRNPT